MEKRERKKVEKLVKRKKNGKKRRRVKMTEKNIVLIFLLLELYG